MLKPNSTCLWMRLMVLVKNKTIKFETSLILFTMRACEWPHNYTRTITNTLSP